MDTQFTALQVPVAPSSGADFFLGALLMLRCRFFLFFIVYMCSCLVIISIEKERFELLLQKQQLNNFSIQNECL